MNTKKLMPYPPYGGYGERPPTLQVGPHSGQSASTTARAAVARCWLLCVWLLASLLGFNAGGRMKLYGLQEVTPQGAPHQLSVPVEDEPLRWRAADGQSARPWWLDRQPRSPDGGGEDWVLLRTDPCDDQAACDRALDEKIHAAFQQLVVRWTGRPEATWFIKKSVADLRQKYVDKDVYHEVADSPVGQLHVKYARMHLPTQLKDEVHGQWSRVVQALRLLRTGAVAFVVIGALAVLRCWLRWDSRTRGYLSGLLAVLAALLMILLAGLGWSVWSFTPLWLQLVW